MRFIKKGSSKPRVDIDGQAAAKARREAERTVSEKLQAIVDGTSDHANRHVIPPGEYELDQPLRITKLRTRLALDGVTFTGPHATEPFVLDGGSIFADD